MKLKEIRVEGYKNLGKCVLSMRDFNVVVGPNNSGKTNLLEVFRVLWCLCWGAEDDRRAFLKGAPPYRNEREDFTFSRPSGSRLALGFTFETEVDGDAWVVDFDLSVKRAVRPRADEGMGFESERLKAKQPSKTGPARTFLCRDKKELRIGEKVHRIPLFTSGIAAVSVLYPEPGSSPRELETFIRDIQTIAATPIYALSAQALRANLRRDALPSEHRHSSFGLLAAINELHESTEKYTIFRNAVCEILDLEDIEFKVCAITFPRSKGDQEKETDRVKFCFIRRRWGEYAELAEYSDGTLIVTALVAALVLRDPTQGLTCVEELENCLHPSALERLLRFLRSNANKWQLVVTTHSPYLVNGVEPDDVLVAVVGKNGLSEFGKPGKRREIDELLKRGYMSFGELMVTNFEDKVVLPR